MILLNSVSSLPLVFGGLIALATMLVWQAFAPARSTSSIAKRLDSYVDREDLVLADELSLPLVRRVIVPIIYRLLSSFGALMPKRSLQLISKQLIYAGAPGKLSALDFLGLRLIVAIGLAGSYLYNQSALSVAEYSTASILALIGSLFPSIWLRRRVHNRQNEILRSLPDALDMLTIGVEAGLAFESALLKVGNKWDNALSREFRLVVTDMRIGGSRNDALQRMVERTGVEELSTFVAVLVQSNEMGISISQVLNTQAHQMRLKRRQRAEELARQASVKMVVTMVIFIFPAMFIVLLGPTAPGLLTFFAQTTVP